MQRQALIAEIISQLPTKEVPGHAQEDIVEYLRSKYGDPEVLSLDSDTEELTFLLPDKRLKILRKRETALLTGFVVLAQLVPPPCPNPRVLGVMTVTGSGTGDFNFINLFSAGWASSSANVEAMISFVLSYSASEKTFCRMCVPPCVCNIVATGPYAYTVTHRLIWRGIIPVGIRTTVVISQPIRASCI